MPEARYILSLELDFIWHQQHGVTLGDILDYNNKQDLGLNNGVNATLVPPKQTQKLTNKRNKNKTIFA